MNSKPSRKVKATIIAAVVVLALGAFATKITAFKSPPLVGRPIIGADVAVSGTVKEVISANNVTVVVDDVKAYSPGYMSGYAFVIVQTSISNESCYLITTDNIRLVDDFSNTYADWGTLAVDFQLSRLPNIISSRQTGIGALVFQVPESALANKLRLTVKLEPSACTSLSTLLVVFFDEAIPITTYH